MKIHTEKYGHGMAIFLSVGIFLKVAELKPAWPQATSETITFEPIEI